MPKATTLTIADAAALLTVSYTRCYNLALRGELELRQVDGKRHVTVASVERLRRQREAAQ